jgi:hypothetical protein
MTGRPEQNEASRCPHCGNLAKIESAGWARYRCLICGGPRIPGRGADAGTADAEASPLFLAKRRHRAFLAYRALAAVVGGAGLAFVSTTLLILLLASATLTTSLLSLAFASIPVLLGAWAWRRGSRAKRERNEALDSAWVAAGYVTLGELGGELSARTLAEKLGVEESYADQVLARLSVDDEVTSRVTDDGEVVYRAVSKGRFRVQAPPTEDMLAEAYEELERQGESLAKKH